MSIILKKNKEVIKVNIWFDIILVLILIFYRPVWLITIGVIVNIVLIGCYFIIKKYYYIFDMLIQTNKFSKSLNSVLERL